MAPLFDPSDFQIEPGTVHVCAGGETPFLRRHREAYEAHARDKSRGYAGRLALDATVDTVRATVARAWQTETAAIGFAGSVAEGVSVVTESLALGPGDNVIFERNEYPSVVLPALVRAERVGFEVRFADSAEEIAAAADANTRMIAVSRVSYLNGAKRELAALRAVADRSGALLIADFTQAAGYMPIRVELCDFAFSSCYKWLLGCTGVAVCFWNRARQPDWRPGTAGWYSVRSGAGRPHYADGVSLRDDAMLFCRGNPAHLPVYILASALDYLGRFDSETVDAHVHRLTAAALEVFDRLGLAVITPRDPARHGASVAFESEASDTVTHALADQGVLAFGGRNRVRFSFHGYNSLDEIDRIETALKQVALKQVVPKQGAL